MSSDCDELESWLNRNAGTLPDKGPWQVSGPRFKTTKSNIYQATSLNNGKTLAVKRYFTGDAVKQFHALKITLEILENTSQFSAPRPYTIRTEPDAAIAMDWIEGPTLEDQTQSLETGPNNLSANLALAGQALSCIHQHSQKTTGALDTRDFLNDIILAREGLDKMPSHVFDSINWLEKTSQRVANTDLACVDLHGDYKPANLILADNKVVVIDGLFSGHGPAIHDMAQFLNHMSLDLYHPLRLHQFPIKTRRERIFLDQFANIEKMDTTLPLSWLRVQKLVLLQIERTRQPISIGTKYLEYCSTLDCQKIIKSTL